jgi:transposase
VIIGKIASRGEAPIVTASNAQVSKMMKELERSGEIGRAAAKAGIDRKTARKYAGLGKLPSELKEPRAYRTRVDPIAPEDWAWLRQKLAQTPGLEAKTLFELLQEHKPGVYEDGQLRTLQRKVKHWRASEGPDKEVFFAQAHRPGEAAQLDFTHATELQVSIMGVAFAHLLCHVVLPFSNWEWVTVCLSESFAALRRGLQSALFRLGHHPQRLQTDNSTAATHKVGDIARGFNRDYVAMLAHFDMKPRATGIGEKQQNGDVEASHRCLKSRIEQRLLVRACRDFESIEAYERWLAEDPVERGNRGRRERLTQELAVMPKLNAARLPEFKELDVKVTSWSTIRVDHNAYSVPSRLIGETLRVRIYEQKLLVYFAQTAPIEIERLTGRNGHRINYRHIIWSLVQKPGAFARYRYREDLFPSLMFRRAYDEVVGSTPTTKKDLEYLRILHLAAATSEREVETALALVLDARRVPEVDGIKELIGRPQRPGETPQLKEVAVDLADYDLMLDVGGMV